MAEKENKDFNNPDVNIPKLTEEQKQAGQQISEIMKNGFGDETDKKEKKKEDKKYQKEQKQFEKEMEKQIKKRQKQERPLTEKQKKRKENLQKVKDTTKSLYECFTNFLTKLRYFVLNGPIEYKKWRDSQAAQEAKFGLCKATSNKDDKDINIKVIDVAKEKGFDAIVKDNKKEQKKQIYISGNGHDAYVSINKYGQILDAKASVLTPASKEEKNEINTIIQKTRSEYKKDKNFNEKICENLKKTGYEVSVGDNCLYISKDNDNFLAREYSSSTPDIFKHSVSNDLNVIHTVSALAKEVKETTEKQLAKDLNCFVKIGENEKGAFIEIEEKTKGKYSLEEIKKLLKPETKIDIQKDGKEYQIQNKDGKLILIEREGEKEEVYSDEKIIKDKLKEANTLADKQIVQIDKNGNLNLTNEQLNNELCKKLENATKTISSFQDYTKEEEKSIKTKKTTEMVVKNARNLQPGGTFEREQDGVFIKAVCMDNGSCVVFVKGVNDSSEEVSLSGNPKDVTAKLEQAIIKACTETDVADFGDQNKDGIESIEKTAYDNMMASAKGDIADSVGNDDNIEFN